MPRQHHLHSDHPLVFNALMNAFSWGMFILLVLVILACFA